MVGKNFAHNSFGDFQRRLDRFDVEVRERRNLPGVSASSGIDGDALTLSYVHSAPGYKSWLRGQAGFLGIKEEELHKRVLETVRNMQVYTRKTARQEKRPFPIVIFTDRDKLVEHPITLSELIASSKNKTEAQTDLESRYEAHPWMERVYFRPSVFRRFFPELTELPRVGNTFGVVTGFDVDVVTKELGDLLTQGKKPESLSWLVPHESLHAFDQTTPHEEVWERGIQIGKRINENPIEYARVFGPLLKLREAFLSRQTARARKSQEPSRPPVVPARRFEIRPRLFRAGPVKRDRV